ncbi:MAG TPA: ABC transporter permease, partial [Pseudogracilibacillus sp.]|nr:ABC transporter permease [Pseudogracilibacillus sp.]
MTFREFAIKNVLRNMRLYVAYFLSSLFTVLVFFTFLNFAFHPTLTGDSMNDNALFGMIVAGAIIYIFSFFFILYSMSSFLQSRKKEFGLFLMQGMSNRQLRMLIFLENMIIGFVTTLIGMVLGVLFSKLILLIAENVLVLDELPFYFPIEAISMTFLSFTTLFFFISIFVTFVLRTNKLITLMKGNQIGKNEPKASVFLTIVAVVLIGLGYGIALVAEKMEVIIALVPVAILVTIGTYFLFTQLNVFLVNRLKRNERLFWKKTNMLLFSDLSFRMKDNARAFFMVAIISTVSFSAIGTLVGFDSFLTTGIKQSNQISFLYSLDDDDQYVIDDLEKIMMKHNLKVEKGEVELQYFDIENNLILVTTPETYNEFARLIGEEEITLQSTDVAFVPLSSVNLLNDKDQFKHIKLPLEDGTEVSVDEQLDGLAKPDILPIVDSYFIVNEDLQTRLGEPAKTERYVGWQVVEGEKEAIIAAGEEGIKHVGFFPVDYTVQDIRSFWSPVLFVGFFIGVVFFVSAGSFLYFRLYSDVDEDRRKFANVRRLGITNKEMANVISRQMFLLFFVPIFVAIVHGAVALTALANLFQYSLVKESALVLGGFFIIQVIYFVVVRFF